MMDGDREMRSRTSLKRKKPPWLLRGRQALKKSRVAGALASACVQRLYWLRWRAGTAARARRLGFSPDRTYWVSPADIVYCTPLEWNPFWHEGEVRGGDWDVTDIRFEDLDVFQAMRQRWIEGKDWSETECYRRAASKIESGRAAWGCASLAGLDAKCQALDRLFDEIRQQGYKSQMELGGGGRMSLRAVDEVSVNVDRDGKMLFNNSVHRLGIAKLLSVEKIPVRVTVRHSAHVQRERSRLRDRIAGGAASGRKEGATRAA
ncbi:MAG: hypothetical protein C4521_13075 [Actinobacteria bacterium]|nr:MAG: hypothetical protein C4521_13075 [Actinomycetota bacterium]